MKKHELDSKKAMAYFEDNLQGTNKLSDSILPVLRSQPGKFYAFLPENVLIEEIHEFKSGGKTRSLRKETGQYLSDLLKSEKSHGCVFDDVNSDLSSVESNELYKTNGVHYKNEVYYRVGPNASDDLILKCLQYSSAIWHSLCVISIVDVLESSEKALDENEIDAICINGVFVMIEAYDAESYVFWEKAKNTDISSDLS